MLKNPLASVVADVRKPVSSLTASTVTPGSATPVSSWTVPRRVPVVLWAPAGAVKKTAARRNTPAVAAPASLGNRAFIEVPPFESQSDFQFRGGSFRSGSGRSMESAATRGAQHQRGRKRLVAPEARISSRRGPGAGDGLPGRPAPRWGPGRSRAAASQTARSECRRTRQRRCPRGPARDPPGGPPEARWPWRRWRRRPRSAGASRREAASPRRARFPPGNRRRTRAPGRDRLEIVRIESR